MPLSYILLSILGLFVLFGFAHRVLDRMKMTDTWALLIIIGMIIGTLLPNIPITKSVSINIGGAIIPIAVSVYLFIKADSAKEKLNAVLASILAGALVYTAGRILPHEPEAMFIEPNYIYGIIAGLIAYLFGRSRRCAFIAGVMGIILSDITQAVVNAVIAVPGIISIGGAGAADSIVISMIIAVFLSEILGETREKLQGGTSKKDTEIGTRMASSLVDEEIHDFKSDNNDLQNVEGDSDEQDEQKDK